MKRYLVIALIVGIPAVLYFLDLITGSAAVAIFFGLVMGVIIIGEVRYWLLFRKQRYQFQSKINDIQNDKN